MFKKLKKNILFYKQIFRALLRRKKHSNGKILIIQLAGLGDAALLLPFVIDLINRGLEITIICRAGLEDFWRYFIKNHEIIALDISKGISKELIEEINIFKSVEFEAVFSVSISPLGAYIASFFDSANKYGMIEGNKYYKGSRILFKKIYKAGTNEHISSRYKELFALHFPGIEVPTGKISIEQKNYTEPYILIHPGAKWKPRRWAKENYLSLATRLAELKNNVRIIFGAGDVDLFDYFSKLISNDKIKLIQSLSITELIEEINNANVFIGNDSGPVHIANLLNKPTIVLWGPGNLERIRPIGENVHIIAKEVECRPCRQYKDKENCLRGENICLRIITVEEVFEVFNKIMSKE